MRILYITFDGFDYDGFAGSYSYTCQLGLVEGLRQYGEVTPVVILKDYAGGMERAFLAALGEALEGQAFDVAFVPLAHARWVPSFFEAFRKVAPVRVAMLTESILTAPITLEQAIPEVVRQAREYCTHAMCYDELDAGILGYGRSYFWPTAVPRAFCQRLVPALAEREPVVGFWGQIRPGTDRAAELAAAVEAGVVVQMPRPEFRHRELLQDHAHNNQCLLTAVGGGDHSLDVFWVHGELAVVARRRIFEVYFEDLARVRGVLSPHTAFGGYPGRVYEAMAAGCAVLARLPSANGRPRQAQLFRHLHDIALYDSPDELAVLARGLLESPALAAQIAARGRESARARTTESEIGRLLDWLGSTR